MPRPSQMSPGRLTRAFVLWFVVLAAIAVGVRVEARQETTSNDEHRVAAVGMFLTGALTGLFAHEGGHLFANVLFDADPGFDRVEFHGIPFFAITHRGDLTPRREFVVSSAGFWVQHATNEWLLTRTPRLREARAPYRKGLFAFNVLTSVAYSGAAFARTGPDQRDTRGMSVSAGIDERWVGVLVLAPAAIDIWRYFDPDAIWAVWLSRAVKAGCVLLVIR